MAEFTDNFSWPVPKDGFRVSEDREFGLSGEVAEGPRYLQPKPVKNPGVRVYDVFATDPTLYMRFAKLSDPNVDESSITEFANRFGPLNVAWIATESEGVHQDSALSRDQDDGRFQFIPESVKMWLVRIKEMRDAVELWNEARVPRYDDSLDTLEVLLSGLLTANCDVDVRIPTNPRRDTRIVTLAPKNLMGCMLIQLAGHIEQNADYTPCEFCGHDFAVNPADKRGLARRTCSDRCRQARYKQSSQLLAAREVARYKQRGDEDDHAHA